MLDRAAPLVGSLQVYDQLFRRLQTACCVMERFPKSRVEIARLVLHELRTSENCVGAIGVSVVDWNDARSGANWTVGAYNAGTSSTYQCDLALQRIVPRLQGFYELVQKH
jgi:hypothetical protein